MNWKTLQKELDLQKWNKGLEIDSDPTGHMPYCEQCKHNDNGNCQLTQEERERRTACAAAKVMTTCKRKTK